MLCMPGILNYVKYARSVGDRLVVGLDTDERVQQSKGPTRPINSLLNRKAVMEAIRYVDEVVSFGTDDALKNYAIQERSNATTYSSWEGV